MRRVCPRVLFLRPLMEDYQLALEHGLFFKKYAEENGWFVNQCYLQTALNLQEGSDQTHQLIGQALDETNLAEHFNSNHHFTLLAAMMLNKMMLACFLQAFSPCQGN